MSGTVTGLDIDRLEELAKKATPGVWKLWAMEILADQDGTSNVDTAVRVANTFYRDEHRKPRIFDAAFIAEFRNAAPSLLAAARAVERVEALVAEMEEIEVRFPDVGHGVRQHWIDRFRAALGGAE